MQVRETNPGRQEIQAVHCVTTLTAVIAQQPPMWLLLNLCERRDVAAA